jgi:uncharacterized protein DUF1688
MVAAAERTAAPAPELLALRTAAAVRERCALVHHWVADGRSPNFSLDEQRMDDVAAFVAETTRKTYPDLRVPYHSRWRHFAPDGVDRWAALASSFVGVGSLETARRAVDLATVSVLLDAGAGDAWRYREPATGKVFARSEGLAVASLDMFSAGLFSSEPSEPFRVDHAALQRIDATTLARGMQVDSDNPLPGLAQRSALLNRLGAALAVHTDYFGRARPGRLVDYFLGTVRDNRVSAPSVLAVLLDGLSEIWPSGLTIDGVALGDVGRHPAARTGDRSDGLVPFHKLSQWLTYSLLEPLETAGLAVADIDGLTGLAEYRNGGLFVDLGVIVPRKPIDPIRRYDVTSEFVVEWRALTVTLLDRLLDRVRGQLGVSAAQLPLASMLQGGTWTAGRAIAATLRSPQGPPPFAIAADGTVF